MAIGIITSFMSTSTEHLDARRGPYADFADVDARLPVIARRTGLQVDIDDGTNIVTHRFEGGVDISNLVPNDPSVGGNPQWGQIGGTLANQTDLQNALDAKISERGRTSWEDVNYDDSQIVPPAAPGAPTVDEICAGLTYIQSLLEHGQLVETYLNGPQVTTNFQALFGIGSANHCRLIHVRVGSMLRFETTSYQTGSEQVRVFYNWNESSALEDSGWNAFVFSGHTHSYLPLAGGTITGNITVEGNINTVSLDISSSGSALSFTNTDHAYIHGVNSSGGNGWYIGRGSSGSDNFEFSNYVGGSNNDGSGIGFNAGSDAFLFFNSLGTYDVWHTGNAPGANLPISTGSGSNFLADDGTYKPASGGITERGRTTFSDVGFDDTQIVPPAVPGAPTEDEIEAGLTYIASILEDGQLIEGYFNTDAPNFQDLFDIGTGKYVRIIKVISSMIRMEVNTYSNPNDMKVRTYYSWGNENFIDSAWKQFSFNGHTHSYLPLSGGTLTGNITVDISGSTLGTYVDNSKTDIVSSVGGNPPVSFRFGGDSVFYRVVDGTISYKVWDANTAPGANLPISTGDGTLFLANDGTYKAASGGITERGRTTWADVGYDDNQITPPAIVGSPTPEEVAAAVGYLASILEEGQLIEEYVNSSSQMPNFSSIFLQYQTSQIRIIQVSSTMIRMEINNHSNPSVYQIRTFYSWGEISNFIDSGWKHFSFEGHTHSYLPLSGGALTGNLTSDSGIETSNVLKATDVGDSAIWTRLEYSGIYTSRVQMYITPVNHDVASLKIGGIGIGDTDWQHIDIYATGNFRLNDNKIWHAGNAPGANLPISSGDGTLFLANDGTYKAASGSGSYLPLAGGTMTGPITFSDGQNFDDIQIWTSQSTIKFEKNGATNPHFAVDLAGSGRMILDYNGNLQLYNADVVAAKFNGAEVKSDGVDTEYLNGAGVYTTPAKNANIDSHSVSSSSNLGTTLSRAELDTLIPSPIKGELYGVQDSNNHSFLVIYDGTDFWFERFAKAN